jgi:hypothetical protein
VRAQGLEPWTYGLKERCLSDGSGGEIDGCDDDAPCVVPFVANPPDIHGREDLSTAEKIAALRTLLPHVDEDTLVALLQLNQAPPAEPDAATEGEP